MINLLISLGGFGLFILIAIIVIVVLMVIIYFKNAKRIVEIRDTTDEIAKYLLVIINRLNAIELLKDATDESKKFDSHIPDERV